MKAPSDEIYDKSTQGTCGLQICSYLHSFSCCCLQIYEVPRNSTKIQTYSSPLSSKVFGIGVKKHISNFLLVIYSNYGRICISHSFQDIDAFSSKIACFFTPNPCLMPPSGGTPCIINVIYTPLECTFNALQFRR